jgi:hypothetical protein
MLGARKPDKYHRGAKGSVLRLAILYACIGLAGSMTPGIVQSTAMAHALPLRSSAELRAMFDASGESGGGVPGCPGLISVGLNFQGETYTGFGGEAYSGYWYTTYDYVASTADGYTITGTVTIDAVDCLTLDMGGSVTTTDYTVTPEL